MLLSPQTSLRLFSNVLVSVHLQDINEGSLERSEQNESKLGNRPCQLVKSSNILRQETNQSHISVERISISNITFPSSICSVMKSLFLPTKLEYFFTYSN